MNHIGKIEHVKTYFCRVFGYTHIEKIDKRYEGDIPCDLVLSDISDSSDFFK